MQINTIIFGLLTLLVLLLGGATALKFKKYINYLIAFCGGTLVATSLVEILPEAIEHVGIDNIHLTVQIVLLSFLGFMLLDKVFLIHSHVHSDEELEGEHNHEGDKVEHVHNHGNNPLGIISSFGILFHTFLDGLLIGSSFLVDNATFLIIGGVILLHDFTDGISTVTLLLRHKQDKRVIKIILVCAGIATMVGIAVAQILQPSEIVLGYLLAAFTGFFLYLGATDLIPEVHKDKSSFKLIALTALGMLVVVAMHLILPAH